MVQNPTLDPDGYSREIIQDTVRPGIEDYLNAEFTDPQTRTGKTPPLVVTDLPDGGRVTFPHVVVSEQSDGAEKLDPARPMTQHDFAVEVEIHGRSTTEMFNLRDLVRGWFLRNRETLRDAGYADIDIDGNSADWDSTSKTSSWQMTVTGLLHTHPEANS